VTNLNGEVSYINSQYGMHELGFSEMEYDELSFCALNNENPDETDELI
jgi:hypothetical protein